MTPTLDDAITALDRLRTDCRTGRNLDEATIGSFLEQLKFLATETVCASDADGFVIEGALQNGFEPLDDNADLYVCSCNSLIALANRYKGDK